MYGDGFNPPAPPQPGGGGFMPRLGMGGTSVPVPQPTTPAGQRALIGRQAMMRNPGYSTPMASNMAAPRMMNQANQIADQGGVVAGQQGAPPGTQLTQAQRDQMGANLGPQNAALAGYMMG